MFIPPGIGILSPTDEKTNETFTLRIDAWDVSKPIRTL